MNSCSERTSDFFLEPQFLRVWPMSTVLLSSSCPPLFLPLSLSCTHSRQKKLISIGSPEAKHLRNTNAAMTWASSCQNKPLALVSSQDYTATCAPRWSDLRLRDNTRQQISPFYPVSNLSRLTIPVICCPARLPCRWFVFTRDSGRTFDKSHPTAAVEGMLSLLPLFTHCLPASLLIKRCI